MSLLHHVVSNQSISDCSSSGTPSDMDSDDDGRSTPPEIESDDMSAAGSPRANTTGTTRVVLVTGGAGFIGSATAAVLLERGDIVIIIDELNDYYDLDVKRANLDRLTSAYPDRCHVYIGDICDQELVESIFQRHDLDSVIHLAARAGVRPSIDDPFIYVHSNVKGQVTLLEAARRHGVGTFVYASSSSVYGGSSKQLFSESDIVDTPCSQYAATKKSCELMAATYHHLYGIQTSGLRFFTVYGPNGRPDMAPFKFIDRVYRGETMDQYGDGTSERDYTFISDIVQGVVLAVDKPCGNQVFNIGMGGCTSLKYFIQLVQEYLGKKAIIRYLPDQPGDVPRTRADISHAQKMLGYNPTTTFEDGLKQTVDWYLATYGTQQQADDAKDSSSSHAAGAAPGPDSCLGLTVATRVHSISDSALAPTLDTLRRFLAETTAFAPRVAVAVGCSLGEGGNKLLHEVRTAAAPYGDAVCVVPVLNWTGFTPALNALLADAARAGSSSIMFASLEMSLGREAAACMLAQLTEDTLVVGARLPGHRFQQEEGTCMLDGTTTPWNTLAAWSVRKLQKTGFLTVADGLATGKGKQAGPEHAGVEEVSVIALHQSFAPAHSKAKVVRVPGVQWDTAWEDAERRLAHQTKMDSKQSRAYAQQRVLGVASGLVDHI